MLITYQQIIRAMDTRPHPVTEHVPEEADNGHWDECQYYPPRAPMPIAPKPSRLKQRVLLSLLGVAALIVVIVPAIVVLILQKTAGKLEREKYRERERERLQHSKVIIRTKVPWLSFR